MAHLWPVRAPLGTPTTSAALTPPPPAPTSCLGPAAGVPRRARRKQPSERTYLPWACWGLGGWQTPRPRTPTAAAPGRPSDLGEGTEGTITVSRRRETRPVAPGAVGLCGDT